MRGNLTTQTLSALAMLAFSGQALAQGPATDSAISVPHRKMFTKGSYSAFSIAFSAHEPEQVAGRDYDAVWTVKRSSFPENVFLDWYVPTGTIPRKKGIWGYHHIAFGNYEGNRQHVPVTPKQVNALGEFRTSFDWSYSGTENFNLLHEFFLTRIAKPQPQWVNGPDFSLEVGFFLHSPTITRGFHNKGKPVGPDHENNGVTYTVRRNDNYVTFAPVGFKEQLKGTVDWKAALNYLVAHGALQGTEYVNGIAFGIEPTLGGGKGQFVVNRYEVTLK